MAAKRKKTLHKEQRQAQRLALTRKGYDEAAEVMGVSVDALESLLARGRRTLKEQLKSLRADVFDVGRAE